MKVYVGKFRYYYDGAVAIVVATTQERVEQELVKMMLDYIEPLQDEIQESPIPTSFSELNCLGWNHEWFTAEWEIANVHSDGHILKYAMETI